MLDIGASFGLMLAWSPIPWMNAPDELEPETKKPNGHIFLNFHRLIRLTQKQQTQLKKKCISSSSRKKLFKINKTLNVKATL